MKHSVTMLWLSVAVITHHIIGALAGYPAAKPPSSYGKSSGAMKFVPAEKGDTPSCLQNPRHTFCTNPDDYPKKRIVYLIENNMYDFRSILMDETRDTYTIEAMDPPKPTYNYDPKPLTGGYLPPTPSHYGGGNNRGNSSSSNHYYQRPSVSKVANNRRQRQRMKRQVLGRGDDGATDLCPSRASYIMPRAAQSINGDWMYLVNLEEVDSRYTQLVRSETCIQDRCSGSCNAPPGSVAVCQQQFVQKRLVALGTDGQRLNQDIFWFPSCCVCKIRRN